MVDGKERSGRDANQRNASVDACIPEFTRLAALRLQCRLYLPEFREALQQRAALESAEGVGVLQGSGTVTFHPRGQPGGRCIGLLSKRDELGARA
jgi:hypothetical protein